MAVVAKEAVAVERAAAVAKEAKEAVAAEVKANITTFVQKMVPLRAIRSRSTNDDHSLTRNRARQAKYGKGSGGGRFGGDEGGGGGKGGKGGGGGFGGGFGDGGGGGGAGGGFGDGGGAPPLPPPLRGGAAELDRLLRSIDGRQYPTYKDAVGRWSFGGGGGADGAFASPPFEVAI